MCGPYSQVYGEELSTFPTDMKNLPGANGTYLQTNNGYYRFTIYGKNVCGVIQSLVSGNFRVDSEPTPSVAFKVNGTALPTDCNATIPSFFNCSAFPLVLNNESSNISTYDITLQYSTVGSCGLYTQIYETPVPLTSLPTDLNNLPGFNGTFIQDNPTITPVYDRMAPQYVDRISSNPHNNLCNGGWKHRMIEANNVTPFGCKVPCSPYKHTARQTVRQIPPHNHELRD